MVVAHQKRGHPIFSTAIPRTHWWVRGKGIDQHRTASVVIVLAKVGAGCIDETSVLVKRTASRMHQQNVSAVIHAGVMSALLTDFVHCRKVDGCTCWRNVDGHACWRNIGIGRIGKLLVQLTHAGEMSVPMWNSRSYAMLNLDHTKFTALRVGYHSHPSGSVLARLRLVDNDSGG